MNISRKNAFWLVVIAAFCYVAFFGSPIGPDGAFNVTVNGRELEGLPKILVASAGMIGAAVSSIAAFVLMALIIAGTALLVIALLACVALAVLGAALPLLLPVLVPLAVVLAVILALRQPDQKRLT
jgi:hypothetical protein